MAEYHDLKEQNRLNSGQVGFHTANAVVENIIGVQEALDELALAAYNDRNVFAQITAANKVLSDNYYKLSDKMDKMATSMSKILESMEVKDKRANERQKKYDSKMDPLGYCWSHVYKVVRAHNSKTCNARKEGHKEQATRSNPMGGSSLNKDWKPRM